MHDFDSSIIEYLKAEKGLNDKQIEDFSREYATLTDAERSYVIYEVVGKALYKEYPVDIDTFIFDPYFLGNIYGDIIFPMWVDVQFETSEEIDGIHAAVHDFAVKNIKY